MRTIFLKCSMVVIILMSTPASALTFTVHTEVPEFIYEGHLNITGATNDPVPIFGDNTTSDFEQGTLDNLTIEDDTLIYKPELRVEMLNGGDPVLQPGNASAWDSHIWGSHYVMIVDDTFYMFYTGARSTSLQDPRHIGLATSEDGIEWVKHKDNPILRSRVDDYDYTNIMSPVVLYKDGQWQMWYAGNHGNNANNTRQDVDICYATSTDGISWAKYPDNPVIPNGGASWKDLDLRPADIRWKRTGVYVLYFEAVGKEDSNMPFLGVMTSWDGVAWSDYYYSDPLYGQDESGWDGGETHYSSLDVIQEVPRIWTFGNSSKWSIGWITSRTGGYGWRSEGPFIEPTPGTIYSRSIWFPRVVNMGDHYLIYAQCIGDDGNGTIGLFMATPERMTGYFTSRVIDAGTDVKLDRLVMEYDYVLGHSWELHVRWGDGEDSLSDWMRISSYDDVYGVTGRYFQYTLGFLGLADWARAYTKGFYFIPVRVESIDVRVDGGLWRPVNGTFEDWYANITLEEGTHRVEVGMFDSAGIRTIELLEVRVDLSRPVGSIELADGDEFTNSSELLVDLRATDYYGVPSVQISFDPTFSDTTWVDFVEIATIEHIGGEGEVTVYARFMDAAGRVSDVVSDNITIDKTQPVIDIISPTFHMTKDENITFEFEVTDNLDEEPEYWYSVGMLDWYPLNETTFQVSVPEGDYIDVRIRAVDAAVNEEITVWRLEREEEEEPVVPLASWILIVLIVIVVAGVVAWLWRQGRIQYQN